MRSVKVSTDVGAGQKRGTSAIFYLTTGDYQSLLEVLLTLQSAHLSPFFPMPAYFFHICFLKLRFNCLVSRTVFQQWRTYRDKYVNWSFSVSFVLERALSSPRNKRKWKCSAWHRQAFDERATSHRDLPLPWRAILNKRNYFNQNFLGLVHWGQPV